jgi:DnaJ-class molecular chaperone
MTFAETIRRQQQQKTGIFAEQTGRRYTSSHDIPEFKFNEETSFDLPDGDKFEAYDILGIQQNATAQQIKDAYRRKALQLHPDKNRDIDTTENFQELQLAYETLIKSSS